MPTQALDQNLSILDVNVLSEFPATRARYLELTMTGAVPSFGHARVDEVYVYPSAPQDPVPSTSDGYDLTYLPGVTISANNNFFTLIPAAISTALTDKSWYTGLNGHTIAQGATADGVAIMDLGGWYTVAEVALMFRLSQTWTYGGSVEISTDQATWTKVYDSGRGTSFGNTALPADEFKFTPQTVRYIRLTAYFDPAQGVPSARLMEVQVF